MNIISHSVIKCTDRIIYRYTALLFAAAVSLIAGFSFNCGRAEALPVKYDLRAHGLVTGVKDQGLTGSCWAFAAVKSAESNALKTGISSSPDYSESHLAWFSYHLSENKNDPMYGDGIVSTQSRTSDYFPFPRGSKKVSSDAVYSAKIRFLKYKGNEGDPTGSSEKKSRKCTAEEKQKKTAVVTSAEENKIKASLKSGSAERNILEKPDTAGIISKSASLGDTACYIEGGSALLAVFTMARWTGVVDESKAPFAGNTRAGIKLMAGTMSAASGEALRYDSDAHLQNAVCYDGHGRSAIKRGILNNGAVDIGIYYDENYIGRYNRQYYNYYQTKYKGIKAPYHANHCITIIGWNDRYPRKKFKKKPPKNGAWLAMNSYGNTKESGLFYISYYDRSLCDAYNFQIEPNDNYDYVYEYDGFGWGDYTSSKLKSITVANRFKNNEGNTQELRAVSLHTVASYQKCTVSIYTGTAGSPATGKRVPESTITKTFRYPGYHTVLLPSYVQLPPETEYSISVKYYKNKKYYKQTYVPLEGSGMMTSGIRFSYHADKGQSYLLYKGKWYDMTELDYNNACIKGFTKMID